ncbi:MAG TPA: ubiquinol oxidase subunit II [Caulobacteraceae bacterium]|nr:ubiquinol oxidase subunit II [Caulobacteraceae bacterium]
MKIGQCVIGRHDEATGRRLGLIWINGREQHRGEQHHPSGVGPETQRVTMAARATRRSSTLGKVRIGVSLAPAPFLCACNGPLNPVGPVGAGDAQILIDATLVMLAIIVPTILLAFWMAWRYRASNTKADYRPNWAYSGRIEAVTWSIPILTIAFLGGMIWIGSYHLDPFRPLPSKTPPLQVEVVSLDWKWLFIYPQQHIATVNELVVPAGTPVRFSITSASVFNVFFVPRMGSMIYAMPGMVSQLNLQADKPVVMMGQSSHFSGDGFSDMRFQVRSVPAAQFAAWARGAAASGPVLDQAAYRRLERQSQNVKPYSYSGVDSMLFGRIATQALGPAPGPTPEDAAHSGREVSTGGRD